MRRAKAFSPAGISSFFEICDTAPDGMPTADLEKVGARGGGFGLIKGVTTDVEASEAERNSVKVLINGRETPQAETTRTAAQMILERARTPHRVTIDHKVETPIGAGFGSSAAGALTATLALSKALGLNMTVNQLGRIAHVAEIKCKTGLGTVGPLLFSGCILTLEPGAPGIAVIDRIPITADHVVVAGVYESMRTKTVLSSPEIQNKINTCGRKTLDNILADPSLENFLACCLDFARKTGFMTKRLEQLVRLAEKAEAIGCAQNMVGEAIHALTTSENAENVVQAFKEVLPQDKILVANIDLQGARLLS